MKVAKIKKINNTSVEIKTYQFKNQFNYFLISKCYMPIEAIEQYLFSNGIEKILY